MTATTLLPRLDWLSRLRSIMVLRPGQRVVNVPGIGVSTSRRAVASRGNGLLNALIAYWPGDEASGNLLDAHSNGLTLTDTNTVTSATGQVYATARQYTLANNEYHTRASHALLETGNVDFTFAAWVWLDALATSERWVVRKGLPWEWYLNYVATTGGANANKMRFVIRNAEVVHSDAITASAWYLVFGWHDATNGRIGVAVNLSSNDAARTTAPTAGSGVFMIGRGAAATTNWDGRIGPSAFWKSAAGGGGLLTAEQRIALWANGNGLPYSAFTA